MYNKREKFLIIIFVLFALVAGYCIANYTDWNQVCNSWLRYSKTYLTNCVLRGY